nr:hypothetical protein [Tanacetum cinerariifolium]
LKGALKSTRAKFSDYRKRYHVQEKPLYQDAGPGGLVLSTQGIEAQKQKQEKDMTNIRMMANSFEQGFVNQFKVHEENIIASADKLASVRNEFEKLKVIATQLKETRKLQKSLDGNELPAEIKEDQTSLYKDDDKTIRG